MNKYIEEYLASSRRVRIGIENEKRRQKRAMDSYQCYLVYMKKRKLI